MSLSSRPIDGVILLDKSVFLRTFLPFNQKLDFDVVYNFHAVLAHTLLQFLCSIFTHGANLIIFSVFKVCALTRDVSLSFFSKMATVSTHMKI